MNAPKIGLYSPFTSASLQPLRHKSLLLQFLLATLLELREESPALKTSYATTFLPFNWAHELSPRKKMTEHLTLLKSAFPKKLNLARLNPATAAPAPLLAHLTPLLATCISDETLLFFLLNHREEISALLPSQDFFSWLKSLCGPNLSLAVTELKSRYAQRGFSAEVEQLSL